VDQSKPNIPPPYNQDDEITLKELILKIREFWQELWRRKLLIVLLSLIVAGLFFGKGMLDKTTYSAGLSFMVAENGSSEQGRALTPYGMDFGSVGNNKITELARSGRIIHAILLDKVAIGNKYDFIGNHIIDSYGLQSKWNEEPIIPEYEHLHLKDFYFTEDSVETFSQREYSALNTVHELLSGNNLLDEKGVMTISYNDDTDIFRLNVEVLNEQLSMRLIVAIFNELREFYIEETIGRPQRTFELLRSQSDSLAIVLKRAESNLAGASDYRGFTSSLSGLRRTELQRELVLIEQEYGEVLRNKKSMEVLLSNEMPEFQIIDQTFIPVKNQSSKLKSLILGGILGFFLSGIYVLGAKIVRDAMAE
jgi:hypothetical protein